MTFAAGDKPTAEQFEVLRPLWAQKLVDETVNNSNTLQNDDDLFLAVAASSTYEMNVFLRYSSGTTPDIKFAWTFPSGTIMRYDAIIYAAAASFSQFQLIQTDVVACEGSTGGAGVAHLAGTVLTSSTAGTLQLQWAQNTTNASNTLLQAYSFLRLTKVA